MIRFSLEKHIKQVGVAEEAKEPGHYFTGRPSYIQIHKVDIGPLNADYNKLNL